MANKVAVVTGGFGVLGQAVAATFVNEGFRVALLDHSSAPARTLDMQAQAWNIGDVDLSRLESAASAIALIEQRWQHIDVLVNVAGGFQWQTLADGDLTVWDDMYAMNLKTAVVACKAALPLLLCAAAPAIINIGAGAAAKAGAGMGAYTASKAGVQRLTESLAQELKDCNVTVNAILPGTIDTPRNRLDMPAEDFTRWVTPQAIADVIVFLASRGARAITGAAIAVSGRG